MKNRPLIFTLLALIHFCVAISFPVQIMVLYGHSLSEFSMILHKLTYPNLAVIAICLVNTALSLKAHPALKYTLPISMVLIGINNYLVSKFGVDYTALETTLATIVFIFGHGTLFFLNANEVLAQPSLRWWLVPRRFRMALPVWVKSSDGNYIPLQTFDISKSGAFLVGQESLPESFKEGDEISMAIKGDDLTYHLKAKLVRIHEAKGNYPKGVGIHFEAMSFSAKLFMSKMIFWSWLTARFSPKGISR